MVDAIPAFVRNGLPPAPEPSKPAPVVGVRPGEVRPAGRIDPTKKVAGPSISTPLYPAPEASEQELAVVDTYLDDPIIQALLAAYGGDASTFDSQAAQALARHYGGTRALKMMRLTPALDLVRVAYTAALNDSANWENPAALSAWQMQNEAAQALWKQGFHKPEEHYTPTPKPRLSLAQVTQNYAKSDTLLAQAFTHLYGDTPTASGLANLGRSTGGDVSVPSYQLGALTLTAPGTVWKFGGPDQGVRHQGWTLADPPGVRRIRDLNQAPDLHKAEFGPVWFDPSVGTVTYGDNVKDDENFLMDKAIPLIVIAVVSYFTGGAAYSATNSVIAAGATAGATASLVSGFLNGEINARDILKGMFTGMATAYVASLLPFDKMGMSVNQATQARQVTDWGDRLTGLMGNGLVEGALREAVGGDFKEGFAAALGSGLAQSLSVKLDTELFEAVKADRLDSFLASQLSFLAKGFSSGLGSLAAGGGSAAFVQGFTNAGLEKLSAQPTQEPPAERSTEWFQTELSGTSNSLNVSRDPNTGKLVFADFSQTPANDSNKQMGALFALDGKPISIEELMAYGDLTLSNQAADSSAYRWEEREHRPTSDESAINAAATRRLKNDLHRIEILTKDMAAEYPSIPMETIRQSAARKLGLTDALSYQGGVAFAQDVEQRRWEQSLVWQTPATSSVAWYTPSGDQLILRSDLNDAAPRAGWTEQNQAADLDVLDYSQYAEQYTRPEVDLGNGDFLRTVRSNTLDGLVQWGSGSEPGSFQYETAGLGYALAGTFLPDGYGEAAAGVAGGAVLGKATTVATDALNRAAATWSGTAWAAADLAPAIGKSLYEFGVRTSDAVEAVLTRQGLIFRAAPKNENFAVNAVALRGGSSRELGVTADLPVTGPMLPKFDLSAKFSTQRLKGGGIRMQYGDPESGHGLDVLVGKDGVMGFDIRAQGISRETHGSGYDLFASAMLRLKQENIQVNKIRGYWMSGTDSINHAAYVKNLDSMTPEQAALNTWTGLIARSYGFTRVESIETVLGNTTVIFGK